MNDIPSPNEIIPQLITYSENFTRNMSNRIKVNGIFNEFEENTNRKFNKFVALSNSRYKSVKSGNRLENILTSQKKTYLNIADQINEDDILNNLDKIDEEKKKLNHVFGIKKQKELNNLRDKLRISTKDFTKSELRKRRLLDEKINNKKTYYNTTTITSYFKTTNKTSETNNDTKIHQSSNEKQIKEENEEFISSLMKEDKNYLESHLSEYQRFLDLLKNSTKDGHNVKIEKTGLEAQSNLFLTDNFRFLSFKEVKKEIQVKKKDENNSVDIKKLMRFTKKGKETLKRLHYNPFHTKTNYTHSVDTNNNNFDTVNIIRTEANNCLYIDEKFSQKRENLDNFLKTYSLPRLEDYERRFFTKKTMGNILDFSVNIENKTNTFSPNPTTEVRRNKRNINLDFKNIYENKKKLWKEEDMEIEKINKIEKLKLIDTNNFLKTVKSINRKDQLYIDGYSIRERNTNEKIKEFNNLLGNKEFFNKENMNLNLNRFILAKSEIEREKNERIRKKEMEQKQEEEEELNKKREAIEQYKKKIQKEYNVKDENDDFMLGGKEDYIFEAHRPKIDTDQEYANFLQFKNQYIVKKCQEEKKNYNVYLIRRNTRLITCTNPSISKRPSILNLDTNTLIDKLKDNKNTKSKRHSLFHSIPKEYASLSNNNNNN